MQLSWKSAGGRKIERMEAQEGLGRPGGFRQERGRHSEKVKQGQTEECVCAADGKKCVCCRQQDECMCVL